MPTYLAFALPAGLKGEMCIFECEDCGKSVKMIVEEKKPTI